MVTSSSSMSSSGGDSWTRGGDFTGSSLFASGACFWGGRFLADCWPLGSLVFLFVSCPLLRTRRRRRASPRIHPRDDLHRVAWIGPIPSVASHSLLIQLSKYSTNYWLTFEQKERSLKLAIGHRRHNQFLLASVWSLFQLLSILNILLTRPNCGTQTGCILIAGVKVSPNHSLANS